MRVIQAAPLPRVVQSIVAFDPAGGLENNPFFKCAGAAEKMGLRYDIQDDSFMVFFPNAKGLFLVTTDCKGWVAGHEKENGQTVRIRHRFTTDSLVQANTMRLLHADVSTEKLINRFLELSK